MRGRPWLTRCFFGSLPDWLLACLAGSAWLTARLLPGSLPGWLAARLAWFLAGSLPGWLTACLVPGLGVPELSAAFGFVAAAYCFAGRLAGSLARRLAGWLVGGLAAALAVEVVLAVAVVPLWLWLSIVYEGRGTHNLELP